jgi:hypothetical protein
MTGVGPFYLAIRSVICRKDLLACHWCQQKFNSCFKLNNLLLFLNCENCCQIQFEFVSKRSFTSNEFKAPRLMNVKYDKKAGAELCQAQTQLG